MKNPLQLSFTLFGNIIALTFCTSKAKKSAKQSDLTLGSNLRDTPLYGIR